MWTVDSWKRCSIKQDVEYKNPQELEKVLTKLERMPPLVQPSEIDKLNSLMVQVAENKRFLLQGGDCAELFEYCEKDQIESRLKVLIQMSLILVYSARTPIVRIARMAGQYAKPRSQPTEIISGVEYSSFRGDNVNGIALNDREPDPNRLLQAYFHSAATLNYVRSLLQTDFADLHHPENWSLDHVKNDQLKQNYQELTDKLLDSLDFMKTIGADNDPAAQGVEIFMSHEGLLLDYEQRLTRKVGSKHYNLGTHFLWIGDRTRSLNGAHVEYFRGIENPIGVKVGPSMEPQELSRLLAILNPDNRTGNVG
jgi:3-deoxy-7-phosphoheptulonate synthase